MPIPQVLTSPEVGAMLNRSSRTVHRLVHDGRLKPLKQMSGPNGAFLFDPDEVKRFMTAESSAKVAA